MIKDILFEQKLHEAKDGLDFARRFCKLLSKLKKTDSKFDFDLYCSDDVFVNNVKQIDISKQRVGHSLFILNREIKLEFDKNFLDNSNCITKFYVFEKSQAIKDISAFVENNQNVCIKIYFFQRQFYSSNLLDYILELADDTFYRIDTLFLSNLRMRDDIRQSLFNIKSLNLSVSESVLVYDFENKISLLNCFEVNIKEYLQKLENKEYLQKLENNMLALQKLEEPDTIDQRHFI